MERGCNRALDPEGADEEPGPIERCPRGTAREIECRCLHETEDNPEEDAWAQAQKEDAKKGRGKEKRRETELEVIYSAWEDEDQTGDSHAREERTECLLEEEE
ncbi:hypothetical protein NDU88_001241 [Pleurodeles waltl]|uniref:Uncharacterized protein n=1 Tax=Pleurodeles waltl TaxID=8319 RepID=A0AAV7LCJ3_PLEWA|nr:hypothetical protein NDU88_001241 [Pleurodeles waltl]